MLANDVTRVVLVTDSRGFIVDSTSDQVAMNLADEEDFKAHKRRADLDVTIGLAAPNALAGGYAIPVSRRLDSAGGGFAGILTATVDPISLSADYGRSEAPDTAVGVVGLDGIYRSRMLGGKVSFGEKIDVQSLERRAVEIRETRRPITSPIDGVERFLAAARIDRYPFMAVVAVNAETALAGYRHTRTIVIGWAAAIAALILLGVTVLQLKVRDLELSRQQTRRAEAAIRATLECSMDAVSIMSAERDSSGALVDLLITDCNERAAQLLGQTREAVIGRHICVLAPTIRNEGYLAKFDAVIRSGTSTTAEVQASDPHVAGRWLHHQVVPVEDGIALITRDITERKLAEQTLAALAHIDALTKLGNRRDFETRLAESRARCLRSGKSLALLFVDLDGFKRVNDIHGHAAGDELLVEVAKRLRDCVRSTDSVNRLGGDEFTVILDAAGLPQDVTELCDRIVGTLSRPHLIGEQSVICTPSIGVAVLESEEALESLQHRADTAMYAAKRAGKARYRFAPESRQVVNPAENQG